MDSNISNNSRFEQHIIDATAQARGAAFEARKYADIAANAAKAASGGDTDLIAMTNKGNTFSESNTFANGVTIGAGVTVSAETGPVELVLRGNGNMGQASGLYSAKIGLYWTSRCKGLIDAITVVTHSSKSGSNIMLQVSTSPSFDENVKNSKPDSIKAGEVKAWEFDPPIDNDGTKPLYIRRVNSSGVGVNIDAVFDLWPVAEDDSQVMAQPGQTLATSRWLVLGSLHLQNGTILRINAGAVKVGNPVTPAAPMLSAAPAQAPAALAAASVDGQEEEQAAQTVEQEEQA